MTMEYRPENIIGNFLNWCNKLTGFDIEIHKQDLHDLARSYIKGDTFYCLGKSGLDERCEHEMVERIKRTFGVQDAGN